MNLPMNVDVECLDGPCGRSKSIIIQPVSDRVTHLVVMERGSSDIERLVEIDKIRYSDREHIYLTCTINEITKMELFKETDFSPRDSYDLEEELYMVWPYTIPDSTNVSMQFECIPPGELAVRRGIKVYAADGYVGRLVEIQMDQKKDRITHLIVRSGRLREVKNVPIPLPDVERIDDEAIYLKLSKDAFNRLPETQ